MMLIRLGKSRTGLGPHSCFHVVPSLFENNFFLPFLLRWSLEEEEEEEGGYDF